MVSGKGTTAATTTTNNNYYYYYYHKNNNNTPLEKKTLGTIGIRNTESGGGEQLLPPHRMVKARVKGALFNGQWQYS